MFDFKEHLRHTRNASLFSPSLSVFFDPKHLPPWCMSVLMCQTVTKIAANRKRKEFSILARTMGNGRDVWHCHSSWPKWSQTACCIFTFVVFYVGLQEKWSVNVYFSSNSLSFRKPGLQTYHFTVRTSSPNSGFAFPRFDQSYCCWEKCMATISFYFLN